MNDAEFLRLIDDYARLVAGKVMPFRVFAAVHASFTNDLGDPPASEKIKVVKNELAIIQNHLRSRIQQIMHGARKENATELLALKGTLSLQIDMKSNSFSKKFDPEEMPAGKINLEDHKKVIDALLANILLNAGLLPSEFLFCDRCTKFFYHRKGRKKIYCSTRCAKAAAQQKYMKRKKARQKESAGD